MIAEKYNQFGKVLIVDDQYDENIKNLVEDLLSKGFHVQYWDSKSDLHKSISNVRILILDLALNSGLLRGDPTYYYHAALTLCKIPGPYIVILYSQDYTENDIPEIKKAYFDMTGFEFPRLIIPLQGYKKNAAPNIIPSLCTAIKDSETYKLINICEKLLDKSKDSALQDIFKHQSENEMTKYIKLISKGLNDYSLTQEFILNMMRFVMRYVQKNDEFDTLKDLLLEIKSKNVSDTVSPYLLKNKIMYIKPNPDEKIWTGDIFKIEKDDDFWKYQMIISPECDIVWNKTEYFFACKGIEMTVENLKNEKYPLKSILNSNGITGQYLDGEHKDLNEKLKTLFKNRARYYLLWNFIDQNNNEIALCFDFQNVYSIKSKDFKMDHQYERISRLDVPFITEFMQKFANYSTRLGVPPINQPD